MTNKDTSSCTPNPEGQPIEPVHYPDCLRKCTDQHTSSTPPTGEYAYQKTMLSDYCKNYCQNNWNCVHYPSRNGTKQNLINFCQSKKAITQNKKTNKWTINPTYKPICSCFYPKEYYDDLENKLEKNLKLGTIHRHIGNPTCWLPDCFTSQYFKGKLFTTNNNDSTNPSLSIYPTSIQPPSCNIKQFQQCVTDSDVEFINSQGDVTIDQSTKCLNSLRDDIGNIDDTTDDDSLYDTIGIIIVSVVLGIPLLYFIIIGIISLVKKK